jgi:DNA polymerase-3 subunit delta
MGSSSAAAAKSAVVMLSGSEEELRRRALRGLVDVPGVDPIDVEVYVAGESEPSAWYSAALTAPFLSDRRVVVVRNLLRAGGPDDAPDSVLDLKAVPPSARLVLVADDEQGDDFKQRRLDALARQWERRVEESGGKVLRFEVGSSEVKKQLRTEIEALGRTATVRALDLLIEMTGGSFSRAVEELEKLDLFVEREATIQERDVLAVVVPSREWNVFRLVDAIVAGQVAEALAQLRTVIELPQKAEDAAMQRILPALNRQLRLIWQARLCVEAGCAPQSAPDSVARHFLEKPSLAQERDFVIRNAMRAARSMDFALLARCFEIVGNADAALKGLLPSFSAGETLEQMVLRMAEAARGR